MDDDQRLLRIEEKIDKLSDHLGSIDSTLASQHVSLEDHIRRTELLEEEMKPVSAHVTIVNGIMKILLFLGSISGVLKYLGKW